MSRYVKDANGNWNLSAGMPQIDDELDITSENPVQNKVIANIIPKQFGKSWSAKTWSGLTNPDGRYIWSDGDNVYYSSGTNQYVLDKSTSTWTAKTWSGLTDFDGYYIWTDGDDIYYSNGSNQYVLNKSTSTWSTKTWTGLTSFYGEQVWIDGDNIYYSLYSSQYVLDKSTSTWSTKTWNNMPMMMQGQYIWTDGDNIYYSCTSQGPVQHYILDKSTSTWATKSWSSSYYDGKAIWSDGTNTYMSYGGSQKVLNISTSSWENVNWAGDDYPSQGSRVWTDGENIYYSDDQYQYVFDKEFASLGTASTKNYTTSVTEGSEDLVTSGAVYTETANKLNNNSDGYIQGTLTAYQLMLGYTYTCSVLNIDTINNNQGYMIRCMLASSDNLGTLPTSILGGNAFLLIGFSQYNTNGLVFGVQIAIGFGSSKIAIRNATYNSSGGSWSAWTAV